MLVYGAWGGYDAFVLLSGNVKIVYGNPGLVKLKTSFSVKIEKYNVYDAYEPSK